MANTEIMLVETQLPDHPVTEKHFPPFATETFASQLLWLAIFFGLMYLVMSKLALPRVGGRIEARRDRIARDLADAQVFRGQSEQALTAYEKSLSEARARAQDMATRTRDEMAQQSEARRKDLEGKLATKLADAETRIQTMKTDAMSHVRDIAVGTAAEIVEHLTGRSVSEAEAATAVEAGAGG